MAEAKKREEKLKSELAEVKFTVGLKDQWCKELSSYIHCNNIRIDGVQECNSSNSGEGEDTETQDQCEEKVLTLFIFWPQCEEKVLTLFIFWPQCEEKVLTLLIFWLNIRKDHINKAVHWLEKRQQKAHCEFYFQENLGPCYSKLQENAGIRYCCSGKLITLQVCSAL